MTTTPSLKIYGVITVGPKGQVILPPECRHDYGITVGDVFDIALIGSFAFGMSNHKHIFKKNTHYTLPIVVKGEVTIGSRSQFVIIQSIRSQLGIVPGDALVVVGRQGQGLGFVKNDRVAELFSYIRDQFQIV